MFPKDHSPASSHIQVGTCGLSLPWANGDWIFMCRRYMGEGFMGSHYGDIHNKQAHSRLLKSEAEPGPRMFNLSHQRAPQTQSTELIHMAQLCCV